MMEYNTVEALLGVGAGCSMGYLFASKTMVKYLKDQIKRERENFQQRLNDERQNCQTQMKLLREALQKND